MSPRRIREKVVAERAAWVRKMLDGRFGQAATEYKEIARDRSDDVERVLEEILVWIREHPENVDPT